VGWGAVAAPNGPRLRLVQRDLSAGAHFRKILRVRALISEGPCGSSMRPYDHVRRQSYDRSVLRSVGPRKLWGVQGPSATTVSEHCTADAGVSSLIIKQPTWARPLFS
jgi:hypothetical protein